MQTIGMLNDSSRINEVAMRWNYKETQGEVIRTIIAIDGTGSSTGSMALALNAITATIKPTIERTDSVIKAKNRKSTYQNRIIIFRNYNSKYEKLIEKSKLSKDPKELESFLASVKAEGGMGNEAH